MVAAAASPAGSPMSATRSEERHAPFTVAGAAAPLPPANVDTDVIMPKLFLKGVDRSGLGDGAFNLLRFNAGKPNPDFVLNKRLRDACFLVVGPNFGCGSSREHAVWGLQQLGIRALIGTTFAGIFNDNCANNGLLTISLDAATVGTLADIVANPVSDKFHHRPRAADHPHRRRRHHPVRDEPARKEAFLTGAMRSARRWSLPMTSAPSRRGTGRIIPGSEQVERADRHTNKHKTTEGGILDRHRRRARGHDATVRARCTEDRPAADHRLCSRSTRLRSRGLFRKLPMT